MAARVSQQATVTRHLLLFHNFSPGGVSTHSTYLEIGSLSDAKCLLTLDFSLGTLALLCSRQRSEQIRNRFSADEGKSKLAREYGISAQRVDQIIQRKRR